MQRTLHYPDLRNLKTSHRKGAVSNFEYSGGDKRSRVRITDDSAKVGHGQYEVIGHARNKTLKLMYVAVFWHKTPESLATFQWNLLPSFTTLKKKLADSFETLVPSYHNAWRHNPTDSSLRCHSFHNKYVSSAHSTSHDGGEDAEVFPIPNNAWYLWESGGTAPLIKLSEINGQSQVRPLFLRGNNPQCPMERGWAHAV